jgi:hypothetical protein
MLSGDNHNSFRGLPSSLVTSEEMFQFEMSPYPDVRVGQQLHLDIVAAIGSLIDFMSFLGGFPIRFVPDRPKMSPMMRPVPAIVPRRRTGFSAPGATISATG